MDDALFGPSRRLRLARHKPRRSVGRRVSHQAPIMVKGQVELYQAVVPHREWKYLTVKRCATALEERFSARMRELQKL